MAQKKVADQVTLPQGQDIGDFPDVLPIGAFSRQIQKGLAGFAIPTPQGPVVRTETLLMAMSQQNAFGQLLAQGVPQSGMPRPQLQAMAAWGLQNQTWWSKTPVWVKITGGVAVGVGLAFAGQYAYKKLTE